MLSLGAESDCLFSFAVGTTNIRRFSWFSKLFVLKFVNADPFLSGFRLNFQRLFRAFILNS